MPYAEVSYAEVLKEFGLAPTLANVWAGVGHATRIQGWKLHLSSIPTEAVSLLSRVVPCLRHRDVSFKTAKDGWVLSRLNEGELGATQVGKFITIYPRSDDEAVALSDELAALTEGFHGPIIVSDLRLSDVVYTRYGAFNPIITRDRLGQMFLSIQAPDGTLRVDVQRVPFSAPEGVANPFAPQSVSSPRSLVPDGAWEPAADPPTSAALFRGEYLVLEVVRHQPKGSVFRAIDLRDQAQVGIRILKQGRQYCLADEYGRDIRTRLKWQETLHHALAGRVPVARAGAYFEVDRDGYLPLEDIPGRNIESFAADTLKGQSWASLAAAEQLTVLSYLEQLMSAVQVMHDAGYLHRDLSASNIWIGDDGKLYLLDLELAHGIADRTPAFGMGTPGFMSPAQQAGDPPVCGDDVYALGCVMILLLTGLDPRRVLFAGEKDRLRQLVDLTNGAPLDLLEAVARCTNAQPSERPDLQSIHATTTQCIRDLSGHVDTIEREGKAVPCAPTNVSSTYEGTLRGAQLGLLESALRDDASGLWLSSAGAENLGGSGAFQVYRDAHKGVAGVVYLLARMARCGFGTDAARDRVRHAVRWLLAEDAQTEGMPGLHFGEAGVAVAIAEAMAAGLVERDARLDAFVRRALSGPLDWPDITHGAAGQGVAAMYCADRLQDASLIELAQRCADYLIASQTPDGSWEMPPGVDGMSGETLTGFAHGVSGIVYFLAEYGRRVTSAAACRSWEAGAAWLVEQAIPANHGDTLEWPYSNRDQDRWQWWCHGSPGIGLTFLTLYDHTRNRAFAEVARKALRTHPIDIRYPNLSQCHGLGGLGEIYLQAFRVLGDREWLERAEVIARILCRLGRETERDAVSWLVENADVATADLMVGSSGVMHFLLRMTVSDHRLGFPLLLGRA